MRAEKRFSARIFGNRKEEVMQLDARVPGQKMRKYIRTIVNNWQMYVLLLPALISLVVFKYLPMSGLRIAFRDYSMFRPMSENPWVGFQYFAKLFSSRAFFQVLSNTVIISGYKIVFLFPMGVFIALLLNEIPFYGYKKTVQTIVYIPHFLSWVVIYGIFTSLLSSSGILNRMITSMGGRSVNFLSSTMWFRFILVFTAGWKECGWNAIVFVAAIAGIDQELYEAAQIDGAGRIRRITSITLPSILPTITLMFILRVGNLLTAGTEQILVMYNPVVYDVADVIGTYVYRMGIGKMEYSFSTAVGLFESIVGFALVVTGNSLSRRISSSIW